MRYNIIGYFLSEGFRNVLKNKKSTVSCLAVMCAMMLMFGLFFSIGKNITQMMNSIEGAQSIQVFADINATDGQIEQMKNDILKIDGVAEATLVTPQEGFNSLKEGLGNPDAMEGIDPKIIPASYIVTFENLEMNKEVQDQISKIENVDEIKSSDETISTLLTIGKGVRLVTGIILLILIFISIFIIANTIKLSVHARRKEISIMKYVGATDSFIRTPFMIEGVIIGFMSSLISIGVVGILYNWFAIRLANDGTIQKIGLNLINFNELFTSILIVYLVLGAGIGIIGSRVSMRKYLDV